MREDGGSLYSCARGESGGGGVGGEGGANLVANNVHSLYDHRSQPMTNRPRSGLEWTQARKRGRARYVKNAKNGSKFD